MIISSLLKNISTKYLNRWVVWLYDTVVSTLCTVVVCVLFYFISGKPTPSGLLILVSGISFIISGACFFVFKTSRHIIRHSTLKNLGTIALSTFVKVVLLFSIIYFVFHITSLSYILFLAFSDLILTIVMLIGSRIVIIMFYEYIFLNPEAGRKNILIYGFDEKSVSLERRLKTSNTYNTVGFYAFEKKYHAYKLSDLPVYYFNNENDFLKLTAKLDIYGVLFAERKDILEEEKRLLKYCEKSGIKALISPPLNEVDLINEKQNLIRDIKIEDLLGREEISINMDVIREDFKGKTILITGAAGSIGSELCRQMHTLEIDQLILYDSAETPMHSLILEFGNKYPNVKMIPIIGDIRNRARLERVFRFFSPHIVFHAAAYKHVPIMEDNPVEAISTNVIGTKNIADLAIKYSVEKMIMISSDKAVNPTNIMGGSKRLAEVYIQCLGTSITNGTIQGSTKFVTTRFGNVLGSNGSVIPLFRKQIEEGGPVTVTDPNIIRYFMTIPEACRLVMEAATLGNGNDIFVFDMGEPVKIYDLAVKMIELSRQTSGKDIEIKFTGLRKGEKLFEELLNDGESTIDTSHRKIKIAKVREFDYEYVEETFKKLQEIVELDKVTEVATVMKELVPEYMERDV